MRVGIPREVKNHEYRVAVTPAGVHELASRGHDVVIERGAGLGSSITDEEFLAAGAKILDTADEVWAEAELLLKVKEPIAEEYHRLRRDQVLFTYLHLAASRPCTDALLTSGTTSIAYETVQLANGALPLLAPMSEVAGRLATQVGADSLMRANGGRGVLLGGVPGVRPAKVVVLGGGVSGANAAAIAVGMGADVTVLDRDVTKLKDLDRIYRGALKTVAANSYEIEREVLAADLVIGAVLIPGAKAPRLVSNAMVERMKPGSVLVDIAIDQGGCFEDSRPTTHADPDLPGARVGVLLRRQHARCRAAHVDLRADERDTAVRRRARRQGLARRTPRGRGAGDGPAHAPRRAHQRRGGAGARAARRRRSPTSSPDARGKASGIACRTAIVRSHVAGWWLLLVRVRQYWRARQPVA